MEDLGVILSGLNLHRGFLGVFPCRISSGNSWILRRVQMTELHPKTTTRPPCLSPSTWWGGRQPTFRHSWVLEVLLPWRTQRQKYDCLRSWRFFLLRIVSVRLCHVQTSAISSPGRGPSHVTQQPTRVRGWHRDCLVFSWHARLRQSPHSPLSQLPRWLPASSGLRPAHGPSSCRGSPEAVHWSWVHAGPTRPAGSTEVRRK